MTNKPRIPDFVVDYLEERKLKGISPYGFMNYVQEHISDTGTKPVYDYLFKDKDFENHQKTVAIFLVEGTDGIEIESSKKYLVRIKNVIEEKSYLSYDEYFGGWFFTSKYTHQRYRAKHTKGELKRAGFGGVFDNPMFEVEEVV